MGRKNRQRTNRVQRPKVLRTFINAEKVAHRAAIDSYVPKW